MPDMANGAAQRTSTVPRHVVLRIAAEAIAHEDTVQKVVDGKPVKGSVYFRICAALEKAGIRVPATR